MQMTKVVILGGEGNGGVIASCIDDNRNRFDDNNYQVLGFLTDFLKKDETINGHPVLGGLCEVQNLLKYSDIQFMWAIHMVGKGPLRKSLFDKAAIPINRFATVVHRSAFIGQSTKLDPGAFVMANSYVGPASHICSCTLIMANCCIGHNTSIGHGSHVSAGALVSSYVTAGEYSDICLGATVIEKATIGNFGVAGAGSLVLKNINASEVHIGRPAKMSRIVPTE